MRKNELTVRIGGSAGDGSLATGELLSKFFRRIGLYVSTDKDFPSRIRGGHTSYAIRGSEKVVYSIGDYIDVLLCFDKESVDLHLDEIIPGGLIIFDNSRVDVEIKRKDIREIKIPLANISRTQLGMELIKNTMALGLLAWLFDLDINIMKETISDSYRSKGEKIVSENIKAFDIGYDEGKKFQKMENYVIEKIERNKDTILLLGNEAIALGALAAGVKFVAAYPITPSSDVLEFMAKHIPERGGVAIQAESEIAAINMAIGAGYAGIRSMAVTSGPGFDLKTEALGLASMIEAPVVVLDAQRAGPSTGMATKTEQSDVNHAIYGGHGEKPRVVIAPGTVEESFYFTFHAFNIAEKYQLPVILLTDELISWNKQVVREFDLDSLKIERGKLIFNVQSSEREFPRYQVTDDYISPRTIPGVINGVHLQTGDEHDEYGHITERIEVRNRMMDKRMKKMEIVKKDLFPSVVYGNGKDAIVGFGSTIGPILEAMEKLKENGRELKFIRVRTLHPFLDDVKDHLSDVERVFVVENNYTGQLMDLLRLHIGKREYIGIRKYDGRSFKPKHIYEKIMGVY